MIRTLDAPSSHRTAIGVALGLISRFELAALAVDEQERTQGTLGPLFLADDDRGEGPSLTAIEDLVRRLDPSFALAARSSERIGQWLIEDECLVLLSGHGNPERLLTALRRADALFSQPAWITPSLRAFLRTSKDATTGSPRLVAELRALEERLAVSLAP